MGHSPGGATPAGLLQHLGTLPQVVAVALEEGVGPPERHTNRIGLG
jgi:sulfur carrier protein ThiS